MKDKLNSRLFVVILGYCLASSCTLAEGETLSEKTTSALVDPSTGHVYASNEVFLKFKAGTTKIRMQQIAESVDGEIPEFDLPLGYYFVVFHKALSDYSELVAVVNKLRRYPEVIEAKPSPELSDF